MTWKAYIQINTSETSNYFVNEFDVTDEQYAILTNAVENNIPIKELEIYDELLAKAEETADYDEVVEKWNGVNSADECVLVDTIIDDPGDFERFKKAFVGRRIEFLDDDETFEVEETDERCVYYTVNFVMEDDAVADLELEVMAIELFGIRFNYESDDAYPDYELLTDELNALIDEYIEEMSE